MATSKAKLEAIANRIRKVWGAEAVEPANSGSAWAYRFTSPTTNIRVQLHGTPSDGNWEASFWDAMDKAGFQADEKEYKRQLEVDRRQKITIDREKNELLLNNPIIPSPDLAQRAAGNFVAQPANYLWVLGKHPLPDFQRLLIDPALAQVILAEHNHKNRQLRKARVEYWASVMEAGNWRYTHQGIAFDVDADLQDGQHRLTAAVQVNFTLDIGVNVGMPRENFQIVDTGAFRTGTDAIFTSGHTQFSNTISQAARWIYLYNAYGAELRLGAKSRMSNELLVRCMHKYGDALIDAVKRTHELKKSRIAPKINNGVLAASIYLMRESDRVGGFVEKFLDGFVYGTGLEASDPRLALRRYIDNAAQSRSTRITADVQFGILIKAWNDFVTGGGRTYYVLRSSESFPTMRVVESK